MTETIWPRRETRLIRFGSLGVGGGQPVRVESMTKTDTRDVEGTSQQIQRLACGGCEMVRVAVPDEKAAEALKQIVARTSVPVMADIHFDHRLALLSMEAGVQGLRINPGNIGGEDQVKAVADKSLEKGIPLRVGVNAGSLAKGGKARPQGGRPLVEAMVEAGLREVEILERRGVKDILFSMKAFDVDVTVEGCRLAAQYCPYPFHAGITEAGPVPEGMIRSAAGLGILLAEGLADTIRISLTDEPEREVETAYALLAAMGIRRRGPVLISCPTCGRCEVDLRPVVEAVREGLREMSSAITVAVMGCPVNGPGEAKHADVGVAGGRGKALLFMKGQVVRSVPEDEMVQALLDACRQIEDAS